MKDKIRRAKETIQKHRTKIVFSSGVLIGASSLIAIRTIIPEKPLWGTVTSEMLQQLIDDPDGAICWTLVDSGTPFTIYNSANSWLFE